MFRKLLIASIIVVGFGLTALAAPPPKDAPKEAVSGGVAPGPWRDREQLITIANEEAKKAYRKQQGLAADADVGDFDYDRKPTGAVHHNYVEPNGDTWRVILNSTLTIARATKVMRRVEVPLDTAGKLCGEVKFPTADDPATKDSLATVLAGKVVDAQGAAVSGAEVEVFPNETRGNWPHLAIGKTQAGTDGTFRFAMIPAGRNTPCMP